MSGRERFETGMRQGIPYRLTYQRLCDVLAVTLRQFRWHLWIDDEYRGNFATKREAHEFFDECAARLPTSCIQGMDTVVPARSM